MQVRRSLPTDLILFGGELVLVYAADRAHPALLNLLPIRSGRYAMIRISFGRIINVPTYCTNILLHFHLSFFSFSGLALHQCHYVQAASNDWRHRRRRNRRQTRRYRRPCLRRRDPRRRT